MVIGGFVAILKAIFFWLETTILLHWNSNYKEG